MLPIAKKEEERKKLNSLSIFKVRGIIIKESFMGEADKVVTILCKDIGKITAYAKGARKAKSKYLAGTQLFSYSDFVLYDGKKFFSVTQIDIIENFYELRNNFDKLCYGSYFFELIDRNILPNSSCNELIQVLLKSLSQLKKEESCAELVARIFELKFLEYDGYMPEMNSCVVCEADIATDVYFISDGIVCKKCIGHEITHKISPTTIYTIQYILTSELKNLFQFNVSKEILKELRKISKLYMNQDYPYKSLALIEGGDFL